MEHPSDIEIREAREEDAAGMGEVFRATYGTTYSFPQFYDPDFLRRMILGEDAITFVAVEPSGEVVGTASIILEVGAYSDLVGEFGRLAVVPEARGRRVGSMLMERRIEAARERLHVAVIDARVIHPYSVRIARRYDFAVVGFSPKRHRFDVRESTCILARWFDDGLALRRNNPRITAEVQAVAALALENAGLPVDPIIDDEAAPYPHEGDFELESLATRGYAPLLRIERGRVRHREVFGPMRLHYGFFKLARDHADYLIAREGRRIAGAIGFLRDDHDRTVRIFELIAPNDRAVHFLLRELLAKCRDDWTTEYVEIDIRASSPRLQRTLTELGFFPAAYIPAMVFHQVERFDVVRMMQLLVPPGIGSCALEADAHEMCAVVMAPQLRRQVAPRLQEAMESVEMLHHLTPEQASLLAASCTLRSFRQGETLFAEGDEGAGMLVLLEGAVDVIVNGHKAPGGRLGPGKTLGEMGMLRGARHSATIVAAEPVEAAEIGYVTLDRLIRRRPDIGLVMYRNLASGLAEKLRRADEA